MGTATLRGEIKADLKVDSLINALLGPMAITAAFLYARAAWVCYDQDDGPSTVAGLGLCAAVLTWLATFRMGRLFGLHPETVTDMIFPMGVPVYGVHCYMALRAAQAALLRGKLRREAARQRAVIADLTRDAE